MGFDLMLVLHIFESRVCAAVSYTEKGKSTVNWNFLDIYFLPFGYSVFVSGVSRMLREMIVDYICFRHCNKTTVFSGHKNPVKTKKEQSQTTHKTQNEKSAELISNCTCMRIQQMHISLRAALA